MSSRRVPTPQRCEGLNTGDVKRLTPVPVRRALGGNLSVWKLKIVTGVFRGPFYVERDHFSCVVW